MCINNGTVMKCLVWLHKWSPRPFNVLLQVPNINGPGEQTTKFASLSYKLIIELTAQLY